MEFRMFRKYLKKVLTIGSIAASLILSSCSDVQSVDEITVKEGTEVNVRIAIDDIARTAMPDFTIEDFTSIKLVWSNSTTSKTKQWIQNGESLQNAYQMMNNDSFTLTAGTYDFELTAGDLNGTLYKGKIENKTVLADSVISFTLELARLSEIGTGAPEIIVNFPRENVRNIVVKRYSSGDEQNYINADCINLYTLYPYEGVCRVDSTHDTCRAWESGSYIVEFVFYGTEETVLGKWLELVYIAAGKTSKSTVTIDSLDDIYTITYNNANDAEFTEKPIYFTSRSEITLPTPTKENYDFDGWYLNEEGTGTKLTGWTVGGQTENVTLYAKWVPHKYSVKFYDYIFSQTYSFTLEEIENLIPVSAKEVEYNTKVTVPSGNLSRTGYTFEGWIDLNGKKFDFENTLIDSDIELYALWSYEVKFDKNAEDATGTMATQTLQTSMWKYPEAFTANAYERTGFTFLGWATTATATEPNFIDKATPLDNDKPMTLYAVWHDDSTGFVVSFETFDVENSVVPQIVASGSTVTEPEKPKLAGSEFMGWFTSTDGGTTLSSTPYDFDTEVTSSLTLYAKWAQKVFYVFNGGSEDGDGTFNAPFATISQAVSKINSIGTKEIDYKIVVEGTIKGTTTITADSLSTARAKSLEITGFFDNGTAILDGENKGTVLTIDGMKVPVTLSDVTITNGRSGNHIGAAVHVTGEGVSLTIEDGTLITNNLTLNTSYSYLVGALSVVSKATVTMNDGEISGNKGSSGGGVCIDNGTFIMNGGAIKNNRAVYTEYTTPPVEKGYGGGIYFQGAGTFTMNGGEISGNSAGTSGGGIYVAQYYGTFNINLLGGVIKNNTAASGGAISTGKIINIGKNIYIPAGEDGKNEVSTFGDGTIKITSELETLDSESEWQIPVMTFSSSDRKTTRQLIQGFDASYVKKVIEEGLIVVSPELEEEGYYLRTDGYLALTSYAITYKDKGGAKFSGTFTETAPATYTTPAELVLPVPEKAGFSFAGWYLEEDCSGNAVTSLSRKKGDITLYALWFEPTASFEIDNGDIVIKKSKVDKIVTFTATSGYSDYEWTIEDIPATDFIKDSTLSADGTVFTLNLDNLLEEYTYVIHVTAKNKNGVLYSTNTSIKK